MKTVFSTKINTLLAGLTPHNSVWFGQEEKNTLSTGAVQGLEGFICLCSVTAWCWFYVPLPFQHQVLMLWPFVQTDVPKNCFLCGSVGVWSSMDLKVDGSIWAQCRLHVCVKVLLGKILQNYLWCCHWLEMCGERSKLLVKAHQCKNGCECVVMKTKRHYIRTSPFTGWRSGNCRLQHLACNRFLQTPAMAL